VFVPPGKRTVDLVAPLVSWAEGACGRRGLPHALIGHSASGQFLSRLAAFAPTAAKRLVIANPSTWVPPSTRDAVPYGFAATPNAEAALRAYLALPITVLLGANDTGTSNLASEPEASAQGPTRFERGRNTFAQAKAAAAELGCSFDWELAEVPASVTTRHACWTRPRPSRRWADNNSGLRQGRTQLGHTWNRADMLW
jgi:hypothetical protein